MSYVPAALRRTGYTFPPPNVSPRSSGFCALPIEQQRALRQGVEHARRLGDRALVELLLELAERRADLPETLTVLASWRSRLTPEMASAARATAFPDRPLHSVPYLREGAAR
jgi:hypothetical protein